VATTLIHRDGPVVGILHPRKTPEIGRKVELWTGLYRELSR